ncbi:MAG: hypothetical protein K8H86_06760 [Ignavibacteriaceae bacterium]|nr:hypothetical protein [Ignavibacteriaceae bacterium]
MKERFIYLMENYFDDSLPDEEKKELFNLIEQQPDLKDEFEEQKQIKEVLSKMKMKNPSVEVWDRYWFGIYNRIERGLAWIAISIGALIFFGFVSYHTVQSLINDTHTPALVKYGLAAMLFGLLVLALSVIREKYFTYKNDKYKEIQR